MVQEYRIKNPQRLRQVRQIRRFSKKRNITTAKNIETEREQISLIMETLKSLTGSSEQQASGCGKCGV